ncbi:MAG: phage tail tube protein [Clostridium sp.]|nr:phage tail tube protein [Clostridium sp.]
MADNRMKFNRNPMALTQGKAFIDGIEVLDGIKFEIKFTPKVASASYIGDQTPSSRWIGGSFTATMTRYRSTNFLEDKIREYMQTGITPEIKLQGVMTDKNSDYYAEHGEHTITAVGCVMTGDLSLISIDTGGEFVEEVIGFNIKDVIL